MIRTRFNPCLVLICALICLGGCSDDKGTGPEPPPSRILPLANGYTWIYIEKGYDSHGSLLDSAIEIHTVVGDTLIDSDSWHFLEGYGIEPFLYRNDSTGLWWYPADDTAQLFLPYPVSVGDSIYFSRANSEKAYKITCISINSPVTIGSHTCTCILYRQVGVAAIGAPRYDFYYAPDIGLVKHEMFFEPPNPTFLAETLELQSYTQ